MRVKPNITLAVGLFALLVLITFSSQVQASDIHSPSSGGGSGMKVLLGLGAGYHSYYTSWYYYHGGAYMESRWPHHKFNRFMFTGFLELRRLFRAGRFQFSGRGELLFGFLGGTKEDWRSEAGGEKISSGGLAGGIALLAKVGVPVDVSPTVVAVPYLASGVQFMALSSNGKDIGSQSTGYDYDEGWGEYLVFLPLALGVDLEFERIVLGFDLRFALVGGGWTDWEPRGKEPESEGLSLTGFTVTFGFLL